MSETVQDTAARKPARKSSKPLAIVAVVLAQLVAAYFLIGFFLSRSTAGPKSGKAGETVASSSKSANSAGGESNFDHVFVIKDLIVNPAGTNGLRFLLTTIGLEVSSDQAEKECEKRNVQIHDAIINILTSKTLPQLDDVAFRDSLKSEIKIDINRDLTAGSVINVYFSKFIIQ